MIGKLHKLRHTYCSHLAMRGAPAKAVQELARHESLTTALRYMDLSSRRTRTTDVSSARRGDNLDAIIGKVEGAYRFTLEVHL